VSFVLWGWVWGQVSVIIVPCGYTAFQKNCGYGENIFPSLISLVGGDYPTRPSAAGNNHGRNRYWLIHGEGDHNRGYLWSREGTGGDLGRGYAALSGPAVPLDPGRGGTLDGLVVYGHLWSLVLWCLV